MSKVIFTYLQIFIIMPSILAYINTGFLLVFGGFFPCEKRWQTTNAPVGRVLCQSKMSHQSCRQVSFATIFGCFGVRHDQNVSTGTEKKNEEDSTYNEWFFLASAVPPISWRFPPLTNSLGAGIFCDFETGTRPDALWFNTARNVADNNNRQATKAIPVILIPIDSV